MVVKTEASLRNVLSTLLTTMLLLSACASNVAAIDGTPTANQVLTNVRMVANGLKSYRVTRTITETTLYTGVPASEPAVEFHQVIEVSATDEYRISDSEIGMDYIRSGMRTYSNNTAGQWELHPFERNLDDGFFPGQATERPPMHPLEWLDKRVLANTAYMGLDEIDGHTVYVVTGQISMLPAPASDDRLIPADNVRIYADTISFNVVRIEIDRNILDVEREDVGYQVIPGVVDIDTIEVLDYSDHNNTIEITLPNVPTH